jgi:hypothetical protein
VVVVGVLDVDEKAKEEEANIPKRPRSNNTSADVRITVGTSWLASTTTAASSKSIPAKQKIKKGLLLLLLFQCGRIEIFLFVWYLDPVEK